MSEQSGASVSLGTGLAGLLTLAFIVLKLVGVIDWSWWWVLSPLAIPLVVLAALLVMALILAKVLNR